MKRVRSKKIENDKKLQILYEQDIDLSRLQEYTGYLLTTGVEREEEEEHHLKVIISGESGNIPTPVIKRIATRTVARPAEAESEEYIRDTGDIENRYIFTEQDRQLMCIEGVSEEHARSLISGRKEAAPLDAPLLEHFTGKVIETKDVPNTPNPFVCFRKRETKALRKARKTDSSVEKIKKIKMDLQLVKRLLELAVQRDIYLLNHASSIISIFGICKEMNKRLDIGILSISETILRDILSTKLISKSDFFYKKVPSFANLYTCRKSIGSLKKLFSIREAKELDMTGDEIEHLNRKYGNC